MKPCTEPQSLAALLERPETQENLRAVIRDFYDRVFADTMIGFYFAGRDKARLVDKEFEFTLNALGGAISYSGSPLMQVHRPLKVAGGHFDRRLKILKETLAAHDIPKKIGDQWITHTVNLRSLITGDSPGECEHKPPYTMKLTADTIAESGDMGWNFDNTYAQLPESFYARLRPVPVRAPRMVVFNHALAVSLGLNAEALENNDRGATFFSGNVIPKGAEPIAQAYAGHQFGHFTMLGDGRAILLGEQVTPSGKRFDIQLKGSGQTPFSRSGDGRAGLGPMLREYIVSEAMHALGIPTNRSLAVVATGEPVFRATSLPGAILTRVTTSHIRVGTFEYVAAQNDREGIQILADYTIRRHYPDLISADNPYLALLYAVMERQASLVARWLMVGFIHGVMNTDNMALSGETIDYGPCAFMDAYDPATVFSSIDHHGRYAYGNQSHIAQWNCARFAETLLPLLHTDQAQAVVRAKNAIETFPAAFQRHWLSGMRAKLGLLTEEVEDIALMKTLLQWMQQHHADYTNTFSALALDKLPDEHLFREAAFIDWHTRWQLRLERQSKSKEALRCLMRAHNPAIIPRNHHVEKALEAAVEHSDFTVMQRLSIALQTPYEDLLHHTDYDTPLVPSQRVYQTFCGT